MRDIYQLCSLLKLCPDTERRLDAAYAFGTTYQQNVSVTLFARQPVFSLRSTDWNDR
jgi:hypothetical protein